MTERLSRAHSRGTGHFPHTTEKLRKVSEHESCFHSFTQLMFVVHLPCARPHTGHGRKYTSVNSGQRFKNKLIWRQDCHCLSFLKNIWFANGKEHLLCSPETTLLLASANRSYSAKCLLKFQILGMGTDEGKTEAHTHMYTCVHTHTHTHTHSGKGWWEGQRNKLPDVK